MDSINMLTDKKYINTDESLRPYLEQIEEIDTNSKRLEEAAYQLDSYIKALGSLLFFKSPFITVDTICDFSFFNFSKFQNWIAVRTVCKPYLG